MMGLFLLSTLLAAFLVWIKPHGMADATAETQAVVIAREIMERYTNDPAAAIELARKKNHVDLSGPEFFEEMPSGSGAVNVENDAASGLDRMTVVVKYGTPWGPQRVRLVTLVIPQLRPANAK